MGYSRRNFMKIGGLSVAAFGFAQNILAGQNRQVGQQLRNMVGDVEPLNEQDYENRLENAKMLMDRNRIDGLFLSGSVNLTYFKNISWGRSERTFGVVLLREGPPVWVCPYFELDRAQERLPKNEEVRTWHEHESPYKLIEGIIKDNGGTYGRLGVGPTVRSFVLQGMARDAAGIEVVDGAVITEGCRAVKTQKEQGYMDLANRITKLAYREGFKTLREGMGTRDLSSAVSSAHRQMGVSGSGGPQFGVNSSFPHGSTVRRTLSEGDIVLVDGGTSVEGFRSDVTRTVVFGKPSDKQRRIWDILNKAQDAAIKAVRPGAACENIDAAARKVVDDAGFGTGYKYFSHRVGHGIGMEGHEYPYLVKGNKLKLEPGMTFSNEPGIYIPGEFGVRIEDCMVVTENGGKFFGGMIGTAIDKPFGE
ncbi:M24 family metallopeptidase [candidate division KSB1 bacterium]